MFIILYADDILLIVPSIRQLQDLLLFCESELLLSELFVCEQLRVNS